MPNRQNQRLIWIALITAGSMVLIFLAYLVFAQRARDDIRLAGERQLQIIALDLESVLERYETLPYALSYLPLAAQVLQQPQEADLHAQLTTNFKDIQAQAKIEAIYLLDANGNTLVASNEGSADSYVGKNFAFRPYFSEPMQRNSGNSAGHFYGIGNTTRRPGYFISQPVYPAGSVHAQARPIGVIVVKISLREIEKAWRSNEEPIVLSDRNGVIFLGNRERWQYRSLRPLDAEVQNEIRATLQYGGNPIAGINELPEAQRKDFGEYVSRPIGRLGWQLLLFPDEKKSARAGAQAGVITSLLVLVLIALLIVLDQRRRRLEERHAAASAMQKVSAELEHRIQERTTELTEANLQLEAQLAKLRETEQLLRSTQGEVVQTAKLALLGQMSAGITHELNQPLTAIRAYSDNAQIFLQRNQLTQVAGNLHQISSASARMGHIIAQLKGFARKSADQVSPIRAADSVRDALTLLDNEISNRHIRLQSELLDDVLVAADPIRLEQVLINLLRNAIDAVETHAAPYLSISMNSQDGQLSIVVRDNGSGLSEQVQSHLFEPFFTTKASGLGLGLGLAISLSIVESLGGKLSARNHPDGGAEFSLQLPQIT